MNALRILRISFKIFLEFFMEKEKTTDFFLQLFIFFMKWYQNFFKMACRYCILFGPD